MDEIARRDEEEEEEVTFDPEREAYYKDDPKKALKKYFDREGLTHSMNSSRDCSGYLQYESKKRQLFLGRVYRVEEG